MVKLKMEKYMKLLPESYAKIYEQGLLHNWNIEGGWKGVKVNSSLSVIDMTLRDGEQQTGVYFTPEQKLELFQDMEEVGFHGMEVGFPAVSEDEREAIKLIFDQKPKGINFVMCRTKISDIDAALAVGAPAINMFTSSSDFHIQFKQKITREQNIEQTLKVCDYARDHDLRVIFGREDCSRADIPYMVKLIIAARERLKNNWAGYGLSDTVGALTPRTTKWFINSVMEEFGKQGRPDLFPIGMHCHNDYGLATANVLASLEVGCNGLNGTITGIGERAGNTPIEEVITAVQGLLGFKLKINMEKLFALAQKVSRYAGVPIPINKPCIGANNFKHESGIHAAGQLAHSHVYEDIPHQWTGRKSVFRFGKFSGTEVVLKEALEPYGINPNREQLREIVMEVKREQIRLGKEKYEAFVKQYNEVMNTMGMTIDKVVEIATLKMEELKQIPKITR